MTDIRKKTTHWYFQPSIKNSENTLAKDVLFFSTFAEAPRTPAPDVGEDLKGVAMPDVPWIDPVATLDRGASTHTLLGPQITIPIAGTRSAAFKDARHCKRKIAGLRGWRDPIQGQIQRD